MKAKVLLVDDEPHLLTITERVLRNDFAVDTALGPMAALEKVKSSGPYAVVVADRQMPEMDGVELLGKIKDLSPDTVRIMLTGNADLESVIHVVNDSNIFRFLTKPCSAAILIKAVQDAEKLNVLVVGEKELLNKTLDGSIKLLTDMLSLVDPDAFGETQSLRDVIEAGTECLGLDNAWEIHLAAMLASIGNITVPPETLVRFRARQKLTFAEQQLLEVVPETGARLLSNIPRLEGVARIVRYQNKSFDGTGVPQDSVSGHDIPAGARILKIIRDYMELLRGNISPAQAFQTMRERKGGYDPAFLAVLQHAFEGRAAARVHGALKTMHVKVDDLLRGMVLRSNVETKDGLLILRAGHELTHMMLEKIRNFAGVAGVKEPITVEVSEALLAVFNRGVSLS